MPIREDIQTLEPGALVELYELDATEIGGELYRFHGYNAGDISWLGMTFTPWPIKAEGFEMTGNGQQPSPTLEVANVEGFITSLVIYFQDMVGAKMTRRRTMKRYIDSNEDEQLHPDIWYIEQKTSEDNVSVKFELASALDFSGQQLPKRQILANTCSWLSIGGYRGPFCNYTGSRMYTLDDVITTDATKDRCAGLVRSCKLRFGEDQEINYGSFPGAGLVQ